MTGSAEAAAPPTREKRVFLSYAWEDDDYRLWVKRLAARLRDDGVNARLDEWHLPRNGNIAEFMNREIRQADSVLVLCSPLYQKKVRATEDGDRVAGVGWETRLLSSAALVDNQNKVLAALARGAWPHAAPDSLLGQVYFDLTDASTFERNYRQLLAAIIGNSEKAPPLGTLPSELGIAPVEPLRSLEDTLAGLTAGGANQADKARKWRVGRILVTAVVVDIAVAMFVASQLGFAGMTFTQWCVLFSPFALVVAVLASWFAKFVAARRPVKS